MFNCFLDSRLPIDEDDVAFIFEDIHRGRSIIPPYPVPVRPSLIRWDPLQPLTLENIVVMEFKEAEKHIKECFGVPESKAANGKESVETVVDGCADEALKGKGKPEDAWGPEVVEVVKRRQDEVRRTREVIM